MIQRREFITLFAGATVAWPLPARAQQPAMPVIGFLDGANFADADTPPFRQGLRQAGFDEGHNVAIEKSGADGQYERLPELAAALVRRQVAVIAAATPVAALAAKASTTTIPVVFRLGSDPVKDGLVASLNRPDGNVTGVTFFSNLLVSKRMALLYDILPNAAVIAVLVNPGNANAVLELHDAEVAARTLGRQLIVFRATTEREIETSFASLAQQGVAALFITGDAYFTSRRDQIVSLAARHSIATSCPNSAYVTGGALMSYGADRLDADRQFGIYVGRVLKGEKPADLPVMQPTKFELVINLKTAKALGLIVPNSMQLLADEVIE
jgi:putative ABC transport system substrate-binding protein